MERAGCQNCSEWVTEELRPENTCPRHDKPQLFVTTQWSTGQAWYVGYRVLVALGLLAWVLYDYYEETLVFYAPRYGLWFVFATDWAFIGLVLSSMYQAILVVLNQISRRRHSSDCSSNKSCTLSQDGNQTRLPLKYQILWVVYTIAASNAAVVSFSYWTFIVVLSKEAVFLTASSKVKHSVNSLIAVANLFVDGIPFRLLHVVYPLLSGILYVLFTVIYYVCGGRGPGFTDSIYPVLGWQSPGESLVTIGLELLLTILMHSVLYSIFRLRLLLQACCGHCATDPGSALCTTCAAGAAEDEPNEYRELIDSHDRATVAAGAGGANHQMYSSTTESEMR